MLSDDQKLLHMKRGAGMQPTGVNSLSKPKQDGIKK